VPLTIRSFLEDKSQVPTRIHHEEGQTVTAEVSAPEQTPLNLSLDPQPDGSFSATTGVLNASGMYSITVTVTTPTLQRQRTRTLEVHPECFLGSVPQTTPPKVQVTLHSSCPSFKALSIEAEFTAADKNKQRVPLHGVKPNLFEADLSPAPAGNVNLFIRGESPDEGAFTLTKGPLTLPKAAPPVTPPSPEVAKNDQAVFARAGIKLLKINAGLAIVGVLGYFIYWFARRLKGGKPWKKT